MKLVRQVLAAPVKLALYLCVFFPKVNQLGLIGIVWKIGREPEYAWRYIGLTGQKKGIEAAREVAEEIFRECPTDQVAGMMGMLELGQYNLIGAKYWLEKGRQCPEENPEFLLRLELGLADHLDEYDVQAVITKILSRRDLAMGCTMAALTVQAELFLRAKKWDDADAVLERILRVQEIPGLRWMKWTIAKAKGDEIEAERQLRLASTKSHKAVSNIFLAVGWHYLGDIEKTRQYLTKAQQDGVTKDMIIQINRELEAFLEPDSYGQQGEGAN
jgi:hypothetical protein